MAHREATGGGAGGGQDGGEHDGAGGEAQDGAAAGADGQQAKERGSSWAAPDGPVLPRRQGSAHDSRPPPCLLSYPSRRPRCAGPVLLLLPTPQSLRTPSEQPDAWSTSEPHHTTGATEVSRSAGVSNEPGRVRRTTEDGRATQGARRSTKAYGQSKGRGQGQGSFRREGQAWTSIFASSM